MTKEEARKFALAKRSDLYSNITNDYIVNQLQDAIKNYNNIGIYYPIGSEINVLEIINNNPNKSFYLPITRDEIAFINYKNGDPLYDAKFHTKEPKGAIVDRDKIECFIIPCVAISNNKERVGYGKGYYDRYLDGYQGYKIGIIYKELNNLEIACNDFDVKLDLIIEG